MVTLPVIGGSATYTVAPSKIIALGLNYRDHIKESVTQTVLNQSTVETPKEPILFPKTPNVLIGNGESIILPRIVDGYGFPEPRTDYEAELAFIVGRRCRHVKSADAPDFILGFTCMNDVSQRNIQTGDKSGWFRGKSFDTFGPIGPVLVPVSKIGDFQKLAIVCRLNGKTVQEGNTSEMIFGVREILAFVSANFTLEAGDIVLTGTPSGVGPIKPGDVVEVEIERIGVLRNPVEKER